MRGAGGLGRRLCGLGALRGGRESGQNVTGNAHGHAVARLRATLAAQGWLTDMPPLYESSGLNLDKDVVFAVVDEVPKDYDANNDADLLKEY